jgi:hypothetical protein
MHRTIQLKQLGGSVAAILAKDMLERQRLGATDHVFVSETASGILLTAVDPTLMAGLAACAEAAKVNQAAMAALASL